MRNNILILYEMLFSLIWSAVSITPFWKPVQMLLDRVLVCSLSLSLLTEKHSLTQHGWIFYSSNSQYHSYSGCFSLNWNWPLICLGSSSDMLWETQWLWYTEVECKEGRFTCPPAARTGYWDEGPVKTNPLSLHPAMKINCLTGTHWSYTRKDGN